MDEIWGKNGKGYALFGKTDKWSGRITPVFPKGSLSALKKDLEKPEFVKHDYYPAWKYRDVKIKEVAFVKGRQKHLPLKEF